MCMVATATVAEKGVVSALSPPPPPPPPRSHPLPLPLPLPRCAPILLGQEVPLTRRQLEDILFDACAGCLLLTMSCMPPGVLAVRAVRANQAKGETGPLPGNNFNQHLSEHPPMKYSSKLMNSIWGLYNRYSVHNFKKNAYGEPASNGVQQHMYVAAAAPLNSAFLESLLQH